VPQYKFGPPQCLALRQPPQEGRILRVTLPPEIISGKVECTIFFYELCGIMRAINPSKSYDLAQEVL
jgi:hypothetical protein